MMKQLGTTTYLTCFAVLLFSQLIGWTAAAQYRVRADKNQLISKFLEPYTDKQLTLGQVDKIVQEITQAGFYQMVYAERISKGEIIIRAQESKRLAKLTIVGNNYFSSDKIKEKIGLNLKKNTTSLEIKQAIEKLRNLYQEAGFYEVQITYNKRPTDEGTELVIEVREGKFCQIEEIKVFSQNSRLNKELLSRLQEFENQPFKKFSATEIEKEIANFLLENRFLTAKISELKTVFNRNRTRVKIRVTVSNPTLFEFVFHGQEFLSHFDLIKQSKIGGKFLYLSDSSSEIADNIREYYRSFGFPQVKVTYREINYPDLNKKVILIGIDEGQRIRLGSISVTGKLSRPRSYYIDQIESLLQQQSKSIYYVQSAVDQAADKLLTIMKNQGYLLAELISSEVKIDNRGFAHIEIQFDEGILTYIRQVLFRGARAFNNIELKEQVDLQANTPLELHKVEKSFAVLENFYKQHGYLEFKLKDRDANVVKYNLGQPFADIVFEINEGPKILVKEIVVKGNSKTKEYVIRRELDFVKSEVLTQAKVDRSIDLLEKTGLFSQVRINSLEKGSAKQERTILVEVTERNPGLFSSGIGLNNELDLTARGYLGIVYSNLEGKGRAVSSRLDLKYSTLPPIYYLENRLSLGYYEPYLFADRIRGRVSLVREEEVFAIENQTIATGASEDKTVVKILSRNELNLSAEKEFSRQFKLTYRLWGFSNQTTFDRDGRANTKTINIGTTGSIFELDYRNDQFLPTSGTYTRLDLEYSDPILGSSRDNPSDPNYFTGTKEVNYFKTSLGTTFYVPMNKNRRWVWANSFRGGYLANISNRDVSGVPAVRSFFLGGASTIRGFQNRTERIPSVKELCAKQGLPACELDEFFVRNESTYFLIKTEVRFPLYGIIGGVVFYDGGAVYLSEFDLEDPYRDAFGAGIRIETPVGAFVLEIGFKLDRKVTDTFYDAESPFAINFSLGNF